MSDSLKITNEVGAQILLRQIDSVAKRLNRLRTVGSKSRELPKGSGDVLKIIEHNGPQTVPQVARQRYSSRQNIQLLVNRLAMLGCVILRANPGHKRSALVCLTESGEDMLKGIGEREGHLMADVSTRLQEDEIQTAVGIMAKLAGYLDEEQARRGAPSSQSSRPRRVERAIKVRRKAARLGPESEKADAPPAQATQTEVVEDEFPVNLL